MEKDTLLLLLEECKQGKRTAQKKLYDAYKGRMFMVCTRYAKSRQEAEDMMIEGFGKIFANLGSYNFKGSLEGWMHRIMVHNAINTYYANIKHNTTVEIEEYTEDVPFAYNANDITYEALIELIQELPEEQRVIFNMMAIDDYPANSVSENLGITLTMVNKQYEKAKKQLQHKIAKLML